MPPPPVLTDEFWKRLLDEIHRRQVIPVVGPDMITLPKADGQVESLYNYLAASLAAQLGMEGKLPIIKGINHVVCEYLLQGGNSSTIYDELRGLVEHCQIPVPPALRELVAIPDFELFISTTFDPLLANALETVRHGFHARRPAIDCDIQQATVIDFHYNAPVDLPAGPGTRLYHLLGSVQTYPDFAVWEEDYLEFICGLLAHEDDLKNLFRALRHRNLLLLGAPFSDWGVRFFLRIAKGERLTERRNRLQCDYLADLRENLGEPMIFFFDQVVGCTRIILGSPQDFVIELAQRWRQRFVDQAGDDPLQKLPAEIPKDSVFISYSHYDLPAVRELVRGLRAARIPVWLDRQRIRIGENYDSTLSNAIKDACSFFISVISRTTESDNVLYVHKERAWAAQRHTDGYVFYIPVIIDETDQVRLEPSEFANIHHHQLRDGKIDAEFASRLTHLIEEYRVSGRPRG
jgi:TIR domain-containing protein/SIR2-like protein